LRSIIIYGGTFDPLHKGHLNTAQTIQSHFHFDQFIFLPCKAPVLKNHAIATPQQRIHMLKLGLENFPPEFIVDQSEIERDSPSYMAITLDNFRHRYGPDTAITLLMGIDTFTQLPQWHEWERLLSLGHLMVIERPQANEAQIPPLLQKVLKCHETQEEHSILHHSHGSILRYNAGSFDISSSWIRKNLAEGNDLTPWLPKAVYQFIKNNRLYVWDTL
jgi:nicotinate-nucleotide adenylyltransferase